MKPIHPDIARTILLTGMFVPQPYAVDKPPEQQKGFMRTIAEEGVTVNATIDSEALTLSLSPSVSVYAGHHGKRMSAAVMLEIAAKYAERVEGEVVQHANVSQCNADGHSERHLASYPITPLQFSQLCLGWQQEFLTQEDVSSAAAS